MNIKKISIYLLAAAMSAGFASCTKNGSTGATGATGPAGPAGPAYTGAIDGHVTLYDQYGTKVLSGLSAVTLSVDANTVPVDTTGYYVKGSLPTGTYYMNASATGYGSTHVNSFQFLADTLNRDIKLSAIPNFAPSTLTATPNSIGDSLTITFPPDARGRNCIIFLNKNAAGNTPDKYLLVYTKAITGNSPRPTTFIIPAQDLTDAGFTAGQTVNVAVYGYVIGDVSSYEDLSTGKIVYTPVSSTAMTATFTAP